MPYKLRKAPQRNLYWVVNKETGEKYSKDPLPEERAKAQMRALYAAMQREGGGTHRENVLDKLNLEGSQSLAELARASGVSIDILQKVYNRGIGAYKTNPSSVRMKGSFKKGVNAPLSKKLSKEQWAMARVYSFLDKNPKHDQDLRGKAGGGRFKRELNAAVRAVADEHMARTGRRMTAEESRNVEGIVAQTEAILKKSKPGETQALGIPIMSDADVVRILASLDVMLANAIAGRSQHEPSDVQQKINEYRQLQRNRIIKAQVITEGAEKVRRALAGIKMRERLPGFAPALEVPETDEEGESTSDFVSFEPIEHGQEVHDIRGLSRQYKYLSADSVRGIMGNSNTLNHPLTRELIPREEVAASRRIVRMRDDHLPGDIERDPPNPRDFLPLMQRLTNWATFSTVRFPREAFNIARPPPVKAEGFTVLNPMRSMQPAAEAEADDSAAGVGDLSTGAGMYKGGFIPDRMIYFDD
jgi:hypothetical protein